MAISPPSDILLDVARAADPAQVREATARLARLAADPGAANDGFSKALASAKTVGHDASSALKPSGEAMAPTPIGTTSIRSGTQPTLSSYRKFEAAMLQNFVEAMLPKDDSTFGDENTASIYRTMMAEQLANQIAAAGGIGIAKAVEKAHPAQAAGQAPAAPTVSATVLS